MTHKTLVNRVRITDKVSSLWSFLFTLWQQRHDLCACARKMWTRKWAVLCLTWINRE